MDLDKIIENLNAKNKSTRLSNLKKITNLIKKDLMKFDAGDEVNNHVHTIYSFSPYSPTMAAYKAFSAGLRAVGIMDHDSVSGAGEMIKACKIINMASTVGFEVRANFDKTKLAGKKINNPDSENIVYIALHGIPHNKLKEVKEFLKPINKERNKRNLLMTESLNRILEKHEIEKIDFKKDIYEFSKAREGGSITERHLLYALSLKLLKKMGKGEKLVEFLKESLGIIIEGKVRDYLIDEKNPFYIYDLLGALKSSFLPKIFIQPDNNECISVFETVKFGNSINAIPVYAYLGDITDSPTGDKKAEKFEDNFLDELFLELKRIGFKGITYMPPRNTLKQLQRVQELCKKYEFMEISGVDINTPRQSFNSPIIKEESFSHLIDSTWALIAHEKLAAFDDKYGLFNPDNPIIDKPLQERINIYSEIGKNIDNRHPEKIRNLINF